MRKISILITLFFSMPTVYAQFKMPDEADLPVYETTRIKIGGPQHVATVAGDQISAWYNFGAEMSTDSGVTQSGFFRNNLFPDTTVKANFTGGIGAVWKHSFGQVFDPTSIYHDFPLTEQVSYTVDSIGLWYRYYRFQNTAEDTVVFQFYDDSKITLNQWDGNTSDPDTPYAYVDYNYLTRKGTSPTLEEVVTINNNDTVTGSFIKFLYIPVGITIPAGEKVAASFTYFPGNPYNVGDTIDPLFTPSPVNKINAFVVFNWRDSLKTLEEGKYNHEMVVTNSVRYNYNTNGWNGNYIPGTSWNAGFNHFDMEWKITTINYSAGEIHGGLRNMTVFPNPALKGSEINLKINLASADLVHFSFTDIAGKTVFEKGRTELGAGPNQVSFPTEGLKPGIYFLRATGRDFSSTRKMVIQ